MDEPPEPTQIMGNGGWTPLSVERLQEVLPQYEIIEMLGRGGMGAVYKARQRSLKRLVAIKILPLGMADDEFKFAERFRNEAETLAQMNHPAIVNVYDFGETPNGLLYFVMEFVDGTDVLKMIQSSGRLSEEHALAITAHVCDALAYAHQRGVIHRDIKPANVLINQDGQVKVADFGLAKMHDPAAASGLTQTNMTMGTPDFLAPEALISAQNADHRADLYAVGVMLYQMLTGEVPRGMFKLPSQKGLGADPRLDAIIVRAMEANRDERYQSAIEVRAALDEIRTTPLAKVGGTGVVSISSRPVPAGAVLARHPEKMSPGSGKAIWLLAAAAVAVAGGAGLVVMKRSPEPAARPVARADAPLPAEPEQAEFLARVEKEPAERQIALVQEKLAALNPEKFTLRSSFKEGKLAVLVVHGEVPRGESPQLWPLAAFRRLDGLQIYTKGIADISWLHGMKMSLLTLPNGTFADLSVLKDLPLTHLDLSSGPKRDYTALAGKRLQRLRLTGCPVSDLSFIAGMPLTELFIDGTDLADLSPIRGLPLKEITGDFVPARDAEILRSVRTLAKINGQPAEQFLAGFVEVAEPGASARDSRQTFQGHRYQFVPGSFKWAEAKAEAEKLGGRLAVITSAEENDWVWKTFSSQLPQRPKESRWMSGWWLGATQTTAEKPWAWLTGEALNYACWGIKEPSQMINPPRHLWMADANNDNGTSNWSAQNAWIRGGYLVEWDTDAHPR